MLPTTYAEFGAKYSNLAYINIWCSSPIRVYYVKGEFHAFVSSMESIIPLSSKTALCMAGFINDIIKKSQEIDLRFCYPTDFNLNKIKKIKALTGDGVSTGDHKRILMKFLLLLL